MPDSHGIAARAASMAAAVDRELPADPRELADVLDFTRQHDMDDSPVYETDLPHDWIEQARRGCYGRGWTEAGVLSASEVVALYGQCDIPIGRSLQSEANREAHAQQTSNLTRQAALQSEERRAAKAAKRQDNHERNVVENARQQLDRARQKVTGAHADALTAAAALLADALESRTLARIYSEERKQWEAQNVGDGTGDPRPVGPAREIDTHTGPADPGPAGSSGAAPAR